MSKHSARYSDPTNRKPKVQRDADKTFHDSKKLRKQKVLEQFGLDKIVTVK